MARTVTTLYRMQTAENIIMYIGKLSNGSRDRKRSKNYSTALVSKELVPARLKFQRSFKKITIPIQTLCTHL